MKHFIQYLGLGIQWVVLIMVWISPFQAVAATGVEDLESVQASARKWIDIRLQTSQLQSDWAWQKDLLKSTQEALHSRIAQLEDKETLLLSQMAAESEEIEQSQEQLEQLRVELDAVDLQNRRVIDEIFSLQPFLPPTLADSLELAFVSLSNPDLSIGERLQLVVTILNRCTQFNDKITYGEVVIPNGTGDRQKLLSVLYMGLSHAYAVNKETGDTYLGQQTGEGWQWIPYEGMENEVNRLIAIFDEDSDPELVRVPVHVNTSKPW